MEKRKLFPPRSRSNAIKAYNDSIEHKASLYYYVPYVPPEIQILAKKQPLRYAHLITTLRNEGLSWDEAILRARNELK
jgi:hypothetical protein